MGASQYVGRVGGLAVALGLGAAVFSGTGVASADRSDSGPGGGAGSSSDNNSPAHGRRGAPGKVADTSGGSNTRQQRSTATDSAPSVAVPSAPVTGSSNDAPSAVPVVSPVAPAAPAAAAPARSASVAPVAAVPAAVDSTPGSPVGAPQAATDVVAASSGEPAVQPVTPALAATSAETDAATQTPESAAGGEVSGFVTAGDDGSDGAGNGPLIPVDSPVAWTLLAAARREVRSAASIDNPVAAQVTSSQQAANNGVTVNPTVEFVDGILRGELNATSSRGLELTYKVVGGTASGTNGGKITLGDVIGATNPAQSFTLLPYRTWDNLGVGKGQESWQVRVSEVTGFDKFLTGIPLIGSLAQPFIDLFQKLPVISTLLAPLIGSSVVATVTANVASAAPGETPVAFTYKVTSFDGTLISANWFPASGLGTGDTATTVMSGPGLASPGQVDPYEQCGICGEVPGKSAETLGVGTLRDNGYNVMTWDPRGEFNSGGVLQLDSPSYEARDVSAMVSWIAGNTPAVLDAAGDPRLGMVGGSYGGTIQLTSASTDSRIDAIVPDIAWHGLNESLYPTDIFKTAYGSLLLLSLVATGARINNQIYTGILTGDLFGRLSQTSQALLSSSGPTTLLNKLAVPTLLTQGVVDVLFSLNQSLTNINTILNNGLDTPAKLIWFCGGHGVCADPIGPDQASTLRGASLAWLDQYVKGDGSAADALPNFQWFDQLGGHYTSSLLPTDAGFNNLAPIAATSSGGNLGIIPLIGGSGPGVGDIPYSLGNGAPARNAINVALTVPDGTQVVGAPNLSFTYKGIGNSRAVFAQIVDNSTGRVLGNVVTPVPVTLDGKQHQVSIDLNDIVYTYGGDVNPGSLTLQITSSATAYENASIGLINISNVNVTMPNRTAV